MVMDRVKDKVAIVTGAASGIGQATAQLLAAEGARVVVTTGSNVKGGEETAAAIRESGGEAIFVQQDVTVEKDWKKVIDETLKAYATPDILVNNAGTMIAKKIEETSIGDWRRLMKVNTEGVFLGTKHGILAMKDRGGGCIVNMSSVLGIVGHNDFTSAYGASKGAIRAFTKGAAVECSKSGLDYNIRVNSIHPGVIETPMAAPVFANEEFRKAMEEGHPIGRLGNPMDVAYGVLYLASDEASFITGIELVIDGGWTAH
jgi:NAD(P)-dependent dehydrogenase (short-subunit alcohol dehydrogenase family)